MDQPSKRDAFVLVLSGGGFRATLFHLGVVRFLREQGLLLNVRLVSAVSGGSILAGHLVLNWQRYTGGESEFEAAAEEVVRFTRRDVRGRIQRWWSVGILAVLPRIIAALGEGPGFSPVRRFARQFTLTRLLVAQYEHLYRGRTLADLAAPLNHGAARPDVFLNCVTMTSGRPAAFDSRGLWLERAENVVMVPSPTLKISFAVAASSAFPPMFPPMRADYRTLKTTLAVFPHTEFLADGGVLDNLGIHRVLRAMRDEGTQASGIIVSDAGARLGLEQNNAFVLPISRNVRAADLMAARISELGRRILDDQHLGRVAFISIHEEVQGSTPGALDLEEQRAVAGIRTDLDRFSAREAEFLILHGESAAALSLRDWDPSRNQVSSASAGKRIRPARPSLRELRSWQQRKLRVVELRHVAFWILVLLLGGWSYLGWWIGIAPRVASWQLNHYQRGISTLSDSLVTGGEGKSLASILPQLEPGWTWMPSSLRQVGGWLLEPSKIRRAKAELLVASSGVSLGDHAEAKAHVLSRALASQWCAVARVYAPDGFRRVRGQALTTLREGVSRIVAATELGMAPRGRAETSAVLKVYWGEGGVLYDEPVASPLDAMGARLARLSRGFEISDQEIKSSGRELLAAISKAGEQGNVPSLVIWEYCWESGDDTPPGKRVWSRVADDTWIELFPHGLFQILPVAGRDRVKDCAGTRVYRLSDRRGGKENELFIPDFGCENQDARKSLYFRPHGKEWRWIAQIQESVPDLTSTGEYRPTTSASTTTSVSTEEARARASERLQRVLIIAGKRHEDQNPDRRKSHVTEKITASELAKLLSRSGFTSVVADWNSSRVLEVEGKVLADVCWIREVGERNRADLVLLSWAVSQSTESRGPSHLVSALGGVQLYQDGRRIKSKVIGEQRGSGPSSELAVEAALTELRSQLAPAAVELVTQAQRR